MSGVTLQHFKRAAVDIGAHGDNDTLPFDIDNRFIKENHDSLAIMAYDSFCELDNLSHKAAVEVINTLQIFSERLLVPTGPAGFRITTKLHPFWNIYINGIGVAIAEKHEPARTSRAHSYRYSQHGDGLFDRTQSWRFYREATLDDDHLKDQDAVVVLTDISSFYEHIYHHRLENCIEDLFPRPSTVALQITRFLSKFAGIIYGSAQAPDQSGRGTVTTSTGSRIVRNASSGVISGRMMMSSILDQTARESWALPYIIPKFAAGRSFGLPVGGQCARILAEVMMSPIDRMLSDASVVWHRYVDDFTIITGSQEDAYRALAVLSHALADYGLSLNRTKTTILRAKHYLITYQAHLARSTAWIAPWGACNGRRIGPNGLHDAMSVARIRFPCRCGAWNMRFVRNQETLC